MRQVACTVMKQVTLALQNYSWISPACFVIELAATANSLLFSISVNHWVAINYAATLLSHSGDLKNPIKCVTVWVYNC